MSMQRNLKDTLRITELFYSIQGESATMGWPTLFIRLTGCPLRCGYCDTAYAFSGGTIQEIENIVAQAEEVFSRHKSLGAEQRFITVTGGEPLAQPSCSKLMSTLCDLGYQVSLETSGAFPIKNLDTRITVVMDVKTPDSKESAKNLWENLDYLKPVDQIKFVICSQEDYQWAKSIVLDRALFMKCAVLFSPSYNQISLQDLAEAILADKLPVRLQTQLHKHIWGEKPGC